MFNRKLKDRFSSVGALVVTLILLVITISVGFGLFFKSLPLLQQQGFMALLTGTDWKPSKNLFGFWPYITGTLWVTLVAVILSFPISVLAALYLTEFSNSKFRNLVMPAIDLLSGIPPVVFGVWGVLSIVPLVETQIAPHFVEFSSGYCILSAGIVMAAMIFPLMISVLIEVFSGVPKELRDASLSLGATEWQTIKFVVLRKSRPGIIAALVLALSRAFGETIAVLMVCGNVPMVAESVFDSAYPLPALIANNYGEMLSVPMYDSALMFAAFLLFAIIFIFNAIARLILRKIQSNV